jgi:hypothetical protein
MRCDVAGFIHRDAAGGVDESELLSLLLWITLKLLGFLRDLMLEDSASLEDSRRQVFS